MKTLYSLLFVAAVSCLALPSISHALVWQEALCTTADGRYQISLEDNEGIGPERSSHLFARITNEKGATVGSYKVEQQQGTHSISFGRPAYQDVATKGRVFLLQGPSTNFRHYSLHAKIHRGSLADDGLACSVFGGVVQR